MKIRAKWTTLVMLCVIILGSSGCSKETVNQEEKKKPIVAVSIVPEKTFVQAICKDYIDVITMIPTGSSPENYEPTAQLMEEFADASLYFTIGVPTEEVNILPGIGEDTKVVSLQNEVERQYEARKFPSGERDPHIWLSPKRVSVMIDCITKEVSNLDPDHSEEFKKNAKNFKDQLDEVDKQIKEALNGVKKRAFLVYHPAFGYLADDYGLTMYSLEEEGKEATPKQLQQMIDLAKKEKIKVIFYQDEIDSSQSEAFAEEIGGQTVNLAPLSPNYIENLEHMAKTMAEAME